MALPPSDLSKLKLEGNALKIELQEVEVHEGLSQETICFTGYLHVNDERIAYLRNYGQGGATIIQPIDVDHQTIEGLENARAYCSMLPDVSLDINNPDDLYPFDLELMIDLLLEYRILENSLVIKEREIWGTHTTTRLNLS